ncbi:MAG: GTP-binding protein [Isosphaeraceae bacterium]|nr:GTP-binding protein [Isosphaeraceae bacterium]
MIPRSLGGALTSARRFWDSARPGTASTGNGRREAEAPTSDAAAVIARLKDKAARARLGDELAALKEDREHARFHLVVFGAGAAGKTSLVNALVGRSQGETSPLKGTTSRDVRRTESLEGPEGTVFVTDTPGIAGVGEEGAWDEAEALDLAARADLLLFVVEHDLHRFEHDALSLLVRNGKRSLLVLNKKDRFLDAELREVREKLRERLAGLLPPEDVVVVAAAPRPVPVRIRKPDGAEETVIEYEAPDLTALEERIATVVAHEAETLRAGNLLLRGYLLRKQANDEFARQRRRDAYAIVDRHQWLAAKAVFAVPIPEMDLLAAGAVEYRMISEIAALFSVPLSTAHIQMIGDQMIRTLIRRRLVETATAWVAGLFKSTVVGYAAGGMVQAATVAYLTHVTGHAFYEYFERGQDWGDGGMSAALAREFEGKKRTEFFKDFARQAIDRLSRRLGGSRATGGAAGP